jgi:hypothetical protein
MKYVVTWLCVSGSVVRQNFMAAKTYRGGEGFSPHGRQEVKRGNIGRGKTEL